MGISERFPPFPPLQFSHPISWAHSEKTETETHCAVSMCMSVGPSPETL